MGRERRKWSSEEDRVLREAVEQAERASRPVEWQAVASKLPGRTNKDCRKRWHNSLADSGNEGIWSISEDERLREAVRRHGTKWARVSSEVRTRNGDQCSKRWSHSVNPSLDRSPWTKEEDQALLSFVNQYGHNWQAIVSNHLPHRSALSAKNRHFLLNRKSNSKTSPESPTRQHGYQDSVSTIPRSSSSASGNTASSPWFGSPMATTQNMVYPTSSTRTVPYYSTPNRILPSSSSAFYHTTASSYELPSSYTNTTARPYVAPADLDLNTSFFHPDATSPILGSTSPHHAAATTSPIQLAPQSPLRASPISLRKPRTASSAGSSVAAQGLSPASTAAHSYTGSFSHAAGQLASPTHSYGHSGGMLAHSPSVYGGDSSSDVYPWAGGSSGPYGDSAILEEGVERSGGSSIESDVDAMQRILIEAECAPEQVPNLMRSINAYSRTATFMPGSG